VSRGGKALQRSGKPAAIHVGTYELGYENVDLWLMPKERGGEFTLVPDGQPRAQIKVGGDYQRWQQVVNCLMHEAIEFAFCRRHVRFEQTEGLIGGHDRYRFFMDHNDFSEAIACASEFVTHAIYPMNKAWKKHRAQRAA